MNAALHRHAVHPPLPHHPLLLLQAVTMTAAARRVITRWSCCVAGNDLRQLQVWPFDSFQQLEVLAAGQNGLEEGCLPLLGSLPALQELLLPRNQLKGFPQLLQDGHFKSLRVGAPAAHPQGGLLPLPAMLGKVCRLRAWLNLPCLVPASSADYRELTGRCLAPRRCWT